jgi:hypothetical protein
MRPGSLFLDFVVSCSGRRYKTTKMAGEKTMSKKKRPRQTAQPHFQPISMLPTLAMHIDGMLEVDEEHYHNLLQARPKPSVLDDYTVSRVREVFTKQQKDLLVHSPSSGHFWHDSNSRAA